MRFLRNKTYPKELNKFFQDCSDKDVDKDFFKHGKIKSYDSTSCGHFCYDFAQFLNNGDGPEKKIAQVYRNVFNK